MLASHHPFNGMVLVQGPTVASILVSDCHFAASRPASFRGQADPPSPLWFGGLAFFHDRQVIQIFAPCPPCGVEGGCFLPKLSALFFAESIQTTSLPLKCGWLSSFNNCHHSCQAIQIFSLAPAVWVVGGMHQHCDCWHFGDLQHQKQ